MLVPPPRSPLGLGAWRLGGLAVPPVPWPQGRASLDVVHGRPTGGASLRTPMEYVEYLALGETKHHEYYDGLCVVNPPSRAHSRTQALIVDLLRPVCPPTHEVLTGWGWHIGPELERMSRSVLDFGDGPTVQAAM